MFSLGFLLPVMLIVSSSSSVCLEVYKFSLTVQLDEIRKKVIQKQWRISLMVSSNRVDNMRLVNLEYVKVLSQILVFMFCWTPYAALSLLGILGLDQVTETCQTVRKSTEQLFSENSTLSHSLPPTVC